MIAKEMVTVPAEKDRIIRILETMARKKESCHTGEGLSILEDLEEMLDQELRSAQAWLRGVYNDEG